MTRAVAGVLLAASALGAAPLNAQDVSLRLGGLYAHYTDTLSGSAGAVGLRLVRETGRMRGGLDVAFARFGSGGHSTQAAGSFAFVHPVSRGSGFGLQLDGTGNALSGGVTAGTASAELFGVVTAGPWLLTAGAAAGGVHTIAGAAHPLADVSARARRDAGAFGLEAGVTATWSGSTRFTDATAGLEWRRGPLRTAAAAGVRLGDLSGTTLLQAQAELRIAPWAAIEAALGRYPRDLSGFTSGSFANLGLRVAFGRSLAGAARSRRDVEVVATSTGEVRATFVVPNASDVAIAGEWNQWRPMPLTPLPGNRWEGTFPLGPGAHRFSLVLDGARWVVPQGVPRLPDDFGGEVGILVVGR